MDMRRWVVLAMLAVAMMLTSVVGSVRAEAGGGDKIFFIEERGDSIRLKNVERRADVKVRFKSKDGFSAKLSERTRRQLEPDVSGASSFSFVLNSKSGCMNQGLSKQFAHLLQTNFSLPPQGL